MVRIKKILGKLSVWLFSLLLLFAILLATLQWWAPYALPTLAGWFGLQMESVEYTGDGNLRIQNVDYQSDSLRLRIETIDVLTPTWWFWWGWRHLLEERMVLHVNTWELTILPSNGGSETTNDGNPDLPGYITMASDWWRIGQRWLPRLSLEQGTLLVQESTFQLPLLKKTKKQLEGTVIWDSPKVHPSLPESLSLWFSLSTSDQSPALLTQWSIPEMAIRGSLELTSDPHDSSAQASGAIVTSGGNIDLDAIWARGSWLPKDATVTTNDLVVKPSLFHTALPTGDTVLSSTLRWVDETYQLRISFHHNGPVQLDYLSNGIDALKGDLDASGNLQMLHLNQLSMSTEGIALQLESPVTIRLSPFLPENQTRLKLAVDLSKLAWFDAHGSLSSTIAITSVDEEQFSGDFAILGESLQLQAWPVQSVQLGGTFNQDSVTLRDSKVTLADKNQLSVTSGSYSWTLQTLSSLQIHAEFDSLLRDWLASVVEYDLPTWDSVQVEWKAEGPLSSLQYSGALQWQGLTLPELPTLTGKLSVTGVGSQQLSWLTSLHTDHTDHPLTLSSKGSLQQQDNRIFSDDWTVDLQDKNHNQLFVRVGAIEYLYNSNSDQEAHQSSAMLKVTGLQLRQIQVDQEQGLLQADVELFPDSMHKGSLRLSGGLQPITWLSPLVSTIPDLSPYFIEQIEADLKWDEGPLLGSLRWQLGYHGPLQETWISSGQLQWLADQLAVESLAVALRTPQDPDRTHTIVQGQATIPLNVFPGRNELIDWREQHPWQIAVNTSLNNSSLIPYARDLPISVDTPELNIEIVGSPYAPEGSILLSAPRILLRQDPVEPRAAPRMQDLRLHLLITPEALRLTESGMQVENHPLSVEALLPLQDGELVSWIQQESHPDLSLLSGKLSITKLQLESLDGILPEIIRAQGELTVEIEKQTNQSPKGIMQLSGMGTMPLGPLGSLDNIQFNIQLDENGAILEQGLVLIGGIPVTIDGNARYQEGDIPLFELRIRGENVPFVRSAGLILRADLDVLIEREEEKTPAIKGNLQLRDSILVMDITQFSPSPQSPGQRPPFFSVEAEPFNEWDLDVQISGNRFLTIRNPVLDGRLSVQMNLIGTLQEPQIIGNASLHNAQIKFPFARFNVNQGTIQLDRTNPYDPSLSIQGSTETLGYNLQMNVSGTASNPGLTFSSTPPLSSAQILLLVTAGQPPSGEVNRSASNRLGTLGLYLGSGLWDDGGNEASVFSRLSIESGQRVSERGKETLLIQYRLSDKWYLTGEYDEFDAYNMDIKWKIFSE